MNGFPTVVFLTPEGNEIDRIIGYNGDKEKYFKIIQDYAAGKNTLGAFLTEYRNDSLSVEANYKLADKYYSRWESNKAFKYYKNVLQLDPDNLYGFTEECKLNSAVIQARFVSETDPGPLLAFLEKCTNEKFLAEGYENLAQYYRNEKDTTGYFSTLDKVITMRSDDAEILNRYAWDVFKAQISDKYVQALDYANKAVEISPEASGIWDTVAWLYFMTGDYEKAEAAMQKAVQYDAGYKDRMTILQKAIKEGKVNVDDV
ncbi:tetratricopeptide repeat protein [candidate division KSB1 bacterium]|nr:tetratricopeptide repeat protein [candidate division KSB1 bacterium]